MRKNATEEHEFVMVAAVAVAVAEILQI